MITAFRRYLETWVVRGFFLIMVLAFISWGVGDVIRLVGTIHLGRQGRRPDDRGRAAPGGLPARDGAGDPQPARRAGTDPGHAQRRGARGAAAADHPGRAEPGAAAAARRHAGPGGAPDGVRHAGLPRPERPVRPPDIRDGAAQQRPDRGALPRHDARRSGAAAVARRGQRRRGDAGGAAAPAVSRASSRSAPPTWWNSRSPPRPSRPHRPRPSCSAGTTTIPIAIPRRNTAGSRRSCCRRRRWRRTSRSATPTFRRPTSSARRST